MVSEQNSMGRLMSMRGVWQRLPKLAGESGTLDDDESMRDRCEKALPLSESFFSRGEK